MIIEVPVTEEMIIEATKKAREMGQLKGSMMNGWRNLSGFLGELAVHSLLGGEIHNTYDYDILLNGKKIDVKAKSTNYKPKPEYAATIFKYSEKQGCDYFVFTNVKKDLSKVWVCGTYERDGFVKDGTLKRKGEKFYAGTREIEYLRDNYEMKIGDLKPIDVLKEAA